MPNFKAFFSEITEICDFRWSQGGSFLFIRECIFRGTINSQFQSLFCQKSYVCIRFWGCKGSLALENFVFGELNMHNFRSFSV